MARIFISYARQDGIEVAKTLRQRLETHGFALWQDLVTLEGGRDWWTQIEEAIRSRSLEHLVLVLTPAALESPIIRRELRLARQQGRQVSPIRGVPHVELGGLPRWLGHVYDLDYAEQWELLVRTLAGPSRQVRVPFMAPEPPRGFVDRPELMAVLKSNLFDAKGDAVALTVALKGAGGFGKSALANHFCHDADVQHAYVDGILHVEIGEKPDDLLTRIADLVEILTGERPGLQTLGAASAKLSEALGERRYLFVIDDVWHEQDLRPFLQGGPHITRIITTRLDHILPADALIIRVDAMRVEEGVDLLAVGLPEHQSRAERPALRKLATRLGEWPLLLKLASGFLRERTRSRESLAQAIADVNRRLDARGLTVFDAKNDGARHKAVETTLAVSLEPFTESERTCFLELAVYPEDIDVPLGICARLWRKTEELDEIEVEDLLQKFAGCSLLLNLDLEFRTFRLHDVVRQYLISAWRRKYKMETLAGLHATLISAMGNLRGLNFETSAERRYWYEHAIRHLASAGQADMLTSLLLDPKWLREKLGAIGPQSLISDYRSFGTGRAQELIGRVVDLTAQILARDPTQLAAQLLARLAPSDAEGLATFLAATRDCLPCPSMVLTRPTFTSPGPELRRFEGHDAAVTALAVLDGHRFLSGSDDKTLRLWDIDTAYELRRFTGHEEPVLCLALLDSGRVLSGSKDKTVRLWDVETGQELRRFAGHDGSVTSVTTLDGWVISGSEDKTLRLWDLETGRELRRFVGHEGGVTSITVLDRRIISGSEDKTLRLWDLESGRELRRFSGDTEFSEGVKSLAALDGRRFLSGGSEYSVFRMWDAETGDELRQFKGTRFWAWALAILDDRRVLVGTAGYCDVEVWDLQVANKLRSFEGHSAAVTSLAVLDNRRVLSGAYDSTIRLWDLEATEKLPRFSGLNWWVASFVAIDSRRVLSGSWRGTITLWDAESGQELIRFKAEHEHWVQSLVVFDDGLILSGGRYDKTIRLWDLATGDELRRYSGHTGEIADLMVVDNRRFISCSHDMTLRLWDVETGEELRRFLGHEGPVAILSILRGCIISGSEDKTVRIWDVETGKELQRCLGHEGQVTSLGVLDDYIISGSEDKTLRFWDVDTGQELRRFVNYDDEVWCLAVLDGYIISGGKALHLWNVKTGEEVARLDGDCAFTDLAVLPDKHTVVARDARARLHWIDIILKKGC
jgi:WD40 repeat protein